MTPELLGTLVVLALIDSTSFGTLVIPLWLLATPGRVRPGRVLVFLGTVVVFYFVVGLAILWGAGWAFEGLAAAVTSPAGLLALFALGVGLVIWSFALEQRAKRERREGVVLSGRILAWRKRAVGERGGGVGSLVALAVTATTVELASMLPYLGAIGAITASDVAWPTSAVVVAGARSSRGPGLSRRPRRARAGPARSVAHAQRRRDHVVGDRHRGDSAHRPDDPRRCAQRVALRALSGSRAFAVEGLTICV